MMSENNGAEVLSELVSLGWKTQDTYKSSEFLPLIDGAAVYAIFAYSHDAFSCDYFEPKLAYIGQSENLKSRIMGHEIVSELRSGGFFVAVYFLQQEVENLRKHEAELIFRYSPPFNTIGKKRGF